MDEMELLIDWHRDGERQGPGGDEQTRLALALTGAELGSIRRVADIGCGTGASTRVLAEELDADIYAVDALYPFCAALKQRPGPVAGRGRVYPLTASMTALPFGEGAFDLIWSEGAIYNMGFASGVAAWRSLLRPGGFLAVSEITWLTNSRPAELEAFWNGEYAEMATASVKIGMLESSGYSVRGYFPLPRSCWLDNYYGPMKARREAFLERHGHSAAARALVAAEAEEIAMYEKYGDLYGYGFYVASRI